MAELLTLSVERMSYGPDAIARDNDGKTVFVSGAVPGDVVEAEVTAIEKSFSRARVTRVVEASPSRVKPACELCTACGGCPWSAMSREAQLAEKRANVVSSLVRIGRMDPERADALVAPCEDPSDGWGYRNKVELGFSRTGRKIIVGMHGHRSGDLVRAKLCPLFDKAHSGAVKAVSGAVSYLASSHQLDFERIGIRASQRTGEVEVALWTAPSGFPRAQAAKVLSDATKLSSVVRVMTKGPSKARKIAGVEQLAGKGSWGERIGSELMRVSAPSFFQVNTRGAERLVGLVLEGLDPQPDDEAMDLYCGAGTFTLPLARRCDFVSAVESYGPAVRDLRRNLETARLDNVDAVGGDANLEFPDTDADVIVVDPPRAGLAADVVRKLSEQPARAIAYVSCDPATLARDLARFEEAGTFRLVRITPVDLFPQSFHVECVTLLERSVR